MDVRSNRWVKADLGLTTHPKRQTRSWLGSEQQIGVRSRLRTRDARETGTRPNGAVEWELRVQRHRFCSRDAKSACYLSPSNANAFNSLGVLLAKTGRVDEAIQHFTRALELEPNNVNARRNLAKHRSRNNCRHSIVASRSA